MQVFTLPLWTHEIFGFGNEHTLNDWGMHMRSTAKIIFRFAKPYKPLFAVLFGCILITSFTGAFYPYIFGLLVDEVFYGRNRDMFIKIVVIYGAVYFANASLHFILNMSWAKLMTDFLFDIREECFNKALRLTPGFLSDANAGNLSERIIGDVEDFMNLIHWNVFYTIAGAISMIVGMVIVFTINPWFFLIMLALIPVTAVFTRRYREKTSSLFRDAAAKNGLIAGWVYEIVKGVTEIQLLGAQRRVRNRFNTQNVAVLKLYATASLQYIKSGIVTNGLSSLSRIILFISAAYFVYNGEMTMGAFIAALDYFNNGVRTFQSLNGKGIEIRKNAAKIKRVTELLEMNEEKYEGDEPEHITGGIEFCGVCFAYGTGGEILHDLSFVINEGETVSLAGRSGAGKSTAVQLILRLYEPTRGTVRAFGRDVSELSLKFLRDNISIVLQEVLLFDVSVRDNMLTAKKDATDAEIMDALQNANLGDFIMGLPDGLNTVLGTGGMNFSGGQRQRLSIARIFLKNPKIIILDEATSSLDTETEKAVRDAWGRLRAGRTTIIIAHRYSTIRDSDRVLVIDEGRLAAFDRPEALSGASGAFDLLFKEQLTAEGGL